MYNAVVASSDGRHLYAAGSDCKIRELEEVAGTGTQVACEADAGCIVTALALQPGLAPLWKCSFSFRPLPAHDMRFAAARACMLTAQSLQANKHAVLISALLTKAAAATCHACDAMQGRGR